MIYNTETRTSPIDAPERFTGMQDPALTVSDDSPVWSALKQPLPLWVAEERKGPLIDVNTIPDLHMHPHPSASRVLLALKKLGAFD